MSNPSAALWSQKHRPSTEGELVINKKKIYEVKDFLQQEIDSATNQSGPRLLMISGYLLKL